MGYDRKLIEGYIEPAHDKTYNKTCVTSKDSDQPVHPPGSSFDSLEAVDFFFFLIWVLRPFQEYFTYIEPIVHRRWAKTGEP